MKKKDLVRQIAAQTRSSAADTADAMDSVVHDLLVKLRRGQRVSLPGLGELLPTGAKEIEKGAVLRRPRKAAR